MAYDLYDGQAPAAGVVTGIGQIEGRPAVIVANDATVKAGAWWPETITKILRAQEIAMRNRVPIVYLVDSAGVNLPLQDGIFPGQYGAARIFYYNSLMRRKLRVPQISAVMGMCIAGGAYLPALSDVIIMVKGTSFMGWADPTSYGVQLASRLTQSPLAVRRSTQPPAESRITWQRTTTIVFRRFAGSFVRCRTAFRSLRMPLFRPSPWKDCMTSCPRPSSCLRHE